MWEVTQGYNERGVMSYFVENHETGEVYGSHDCQKWAEAVASYLNEREEHDKRHSSKNVRAVRRTVRA